MTISVFDNIFEQFYCSYQCSDKIRLLATLQQSKFFQMFLTRFVFDKNQGNVLNTNAQYARNTLVMTTWTEILILLHLKNKINPIN
mmetsp:Transcript_188/g.288  ORF Transcript_188/g.288 Transcript_188/m.288 type:complete len:86 (-) Transcript_188:9-266(-)